MSKLILKTTPRRTTVSRLKIRKAVAEAYAVKETNLSLKSFVVQVTKKEPAKPTFQNK